MDRSVTRSALWAAILVAAWPAMAQQAQPPAAETLQVSAQGQAEAEPDTAAVNFELDATDANVKQAYTQVAKLSDKLRAVLKAQPLPSGQAHLGQFTVRRNLFPNSSEVRDFTASISVSLELTDFSKLGPLLDAIAAADLPAVQGVSYALKHPENAKNAAIADGYKRAAAEASALATAEGRHIEEVLYSSVDVTTPAPYPALNSMTAGGRGGGGGFNFELSAAAPLIAPTDEFGLRLITVSARVDLVYRLAR